MIRDEELMHLVNGTHVAFSKEVPGYNYNYGRDRELIIIRLLAEMVQRKRAGKE